MPRVRATRGQTNRAKPKLNSLGDDIVNGMAPAEREAKLNSYIKDFDLKVEEMRQKLEQEQKGIEQFLEKTYYHIRLSLSARERSMKLADYIAEKQQTDEIVASVETTYVPLSQTVAQDTLSKYKSMRKIEPILEEDGAQCTQKKVKRGRPKKTGVTFNAEPTPCINKYTTPATSRNASALGLNTPLVTPKFDPRLPVTPAQKRFARPGEVVMSLAGSPVEVNSENRSRTRTIQIAIPENNELLDDIEIPDDCSAKNLEKVMNILSGIIKQKQQAENGH